MLEELWKKSAKAAYYFLVDPNQFDKMVNELPKNVLLKIYNMPTKKLSEIVEEASEETEEPLTEEEAETEAEQIKKAISNLGDLKRELD